MNDLMRPLQPTDFDAPRVLLAGPVDYDMYRAFRDQLESAPAEGLVIVELSTLGAIPRSRA